jgi:hypothetical protein
MPAIAVTTQRCGCPPVSYEKRSPAAVRHQPSISCAPLPASLTHRLRPLLCSFVRQRPPRPALPLEPSTSRQNVTSPRAASRAGNHCRRDLGGWRAPRVRNDAAGPAREQRLLPDKLSEACAALAAAARVNSGATAGHTGWQGFTARGVCADACETAPAACREAALRVFRAGFAHRRWLLAVGSGAAGPASGAAWVDRGTETSRFAGHPRGLSVSSALAGLAALTACVLLRSACHVRCALVARPPAVCLSLGLTPPRALSLSLALSPSSCPVTSTLPRPPPPPSLQPRHLL